MTDHMLFCVIYMQNHLNNESYQAHIYCMLHVMIHLVHDICYIGYDIFISGWMGPDWMGGFQVHAF